MARVAFLSLLRTSNNFSRSVLYISGIIRRPVVLALGMWNLESSFMTRALDSTFSTMEVGCMSMASMHATYIQNSFWGKHSWWYFTVVCFTYTLLVFFGAVFRLYFFAFLRLLFQEYNSLCFSECFSFKCSHVDTKFQWNMYCICIFLTVILSRRKAKSPFA